MAQKDASPAQSLQEIVWEAGRNFEGGRLIPNWHDACGARPLRLKRTDAKGENGHRAMSVEAFAFGILLDCLQDSEALSSENTPTR